MNRGCFSNPIPTGAPELGAAKAWVKFDGTTGKVLAGYNIASVTRNGTGDYTVVFLRGFSSPDFACSVSQQAVSDAAAPTCWISSSNSGNTRASRRIRTGVIGAGFNDPPEVYLVAYGDC